MEKKVKFKVANGPIMGSYGFAQTDATIEVTEEEAKALERDNRGKAHWTKDEKEADKAARKAAKPEDESEGEEGEKEQKAERLTKEDKAAKRTK